MPEQIESDAPDPKPNPEEPSLGDPIRVFRAKLGTSILIGVCGIVTILLGVALLVSGRNSAGIYPIILGIVCVGLAYMLQRQRCLLCSEGLISVRFGNMQWCRWDELAEIIDQRVKNGIVSSRICVLIRKNGTRMGLADLGISDFAALVGMMHEQAKARGIIWKEEQITK